MISLRRLKVVEEQSKCVFWYQRLLGYGEDSTEDQKTDILSISVKSRMSYLTWGVILYRKRYLLSG